MPTITRKTHDDIYNIEHVRKRLDLKPIRPLMFIGQMANDQMLDNKLFRTILWDKWNVCHNITDRKGTEKGERFVRIVIDLVNL